MVRVYKQGVDSPEMRERPGLKVKIVIYSVFINLEFYQILGNFLNFFFLFFSRNLWFFSFSHPFFTFYLYFTVFFYSRSIFFHIFWTFWSFFWSNLNFCVFLVVFWYLILNTAKLPIYTPIEVQNCYGACSEVYSHFRDHYNDVVISHGLSYGHTGCNGAIKLYSQGTST